MNGYIKLLYLKYFITGTDRFGNEYNVFRYKNSFFEPNTRRPISLTWQEWFKYVETQERDT